MPRPLDIYCIAIGGTGMAPLACLLQEQGHRVRGADGPLYPPMSTLLASAGITPHVGYDAAHLDPSPDLVVVGNAVPRDNPEAAVARDRSLESVSMPQALARFFLAGRKPLVVAGTHGKTTTSSLATWVYHDCGRDPGFFIGGVPLDLDRSFARGSGERFIVEGDEYNAAYFDRGPKFLHYRPHTAILTSVEYDHADLYPTPQDLLAAYSSLVSILPADGLLVACGDAPEVRAVAAGAPCPVVFYGFDEGNEVRPASFSATPAGTAVRVASADGSTTEWTLRLPGRHNLLNALAVWAVARHDGLVAVDVARALGRFGGVRRRQEEIGTAAGVTVVDDFAHHPTAVAETLPALRQRYPGRRLVVAFEPRSLTAGRRMFQEAYRRAFAAADAVFFAPIFHQRRLASEERLDLSALAAELAADGVAATAAASLDALASAVLAALEPGDVIVTMSSGAFADLPRRLLSALEGRKA